MCRTQLTIAEPSHRSIQQPSIYEVMDIVGELNFTIVGGSDGYDFTLLLDGQPNWVPQAWYDDAEHRDVNYIHILELLDLGVNGVLHLKSSLTRLDYDSILMCDFCTEPAYISDNIEDIQAHIQEHHRII